MKDIVLDDPSKHFWLVTGRGISSIHQLIEIVPTLTEEQYHYHVNNGKNDFSNWIADVFGSPEMADLVRGCKTCVEFKETLDRLSEPEKADSPVEIDDHADDATALEAAEEAQLIGGLPKRIARLDAFEERLKELNDILIETNKEGRDVTLPRLVLRTFKSKMQYARISQEEVDFDRVEVILAEAEKELESALLSIVVDVKKDVTRIVSSSQKVEKNRKAFDDLARADPSNTSSRSDVSSLAANPAIKPEKVIA